jgi:hypothetical protein
MKRLPFFFLAFSGALGCFLSFGAKEAKLDSLEAQIKKLNSQIKCKNDDDCIAIEFGHKPCGGPKSYLISSKLNSNLSKIISLSKDYSAKEKKIHQEGDVFSTCDFVEKPQIKCSKGICR